MADLSIQNVCDIFEAKFGLDNTVEMKYVFILLQYLVSCADSLMHSRSTCDDQDYIVTFVPLLYIS